MSTKIKKHRAVSVSSLTKFKKSPKYYWYHYLSGKKFETKVTGAMMFGSAFHCYYLENHNFEKKFIVNDESRNSNAYKELKKDCDAKKIKIIKTKDLDLIKTMNQEALELCPEVAPFLECDGVCEETFTGTNQHGFHITGNIDKYIPEMKAIIELKTINKMQDQSDLVKKIIDEYSITVPHYFELVPDAQYFYFLFQEKEPPYDAAVLELDQEIINGMYKVYDGLMRSLAHCIENESWPGVTSGRILNIRSSDIPPWLRSNIGLE